MAKMNTAPLNGSHVLLQYTHDGYEGAEFVDIAPIIAEAFWDVEVQSWQLWRGSPNVRVTVSVTPIAWAPIPEEFNAD